MTIDEKATQSAMHKIFPKVASVTIQNVIRVFMDDPNKHVNIARHPGVHWITAGLVVVMPEVICMPGFEPVRLSAAARACFVQADPLRKAAQRIIALFDGPTVDFIDGIDDAVKELREAIKQGEKL